MASYIYEVATFSLSSDMAFDSWPFNVMEGILREKVPSLSPSSYDNNTKYFSNEV